MGAWGIKTFENDDSVDWLYELEESSNLSVISGALKEGDSEYIEAPEGCNILAASEILLALQGKPRIGLPENAEQWVSKNKGLDSRELNLDAIKALEKVVSENSEIKELWEETEDFEEWINDVTKMKSELSNS